MPDWDVDSPRLRRNLTRLLSHLRDQARARHVPGLAEACEWHRAMMAGLTPPVPSLVGCFRGTAPLAIPARRVIFWALGTATSPETAASTPEP